MRDNGFVVPSAFQGITGIAHGGYTAGLFARYFEEPVRVTLRLPPPFEAPLTVAGSSLVDEDGRTVMEAEPFGPSDSPLPVVSLEEARSRPPHPRFSDHPYPDCFMCGTQRADGFGLRVSAPDGDGVATGVFQPSSPLLGDDGVGDQFVWAAVDCLTVWSFAGHWDDPEWWPALTGQIQVDRVGGLQRGAPYVLAARTVGRERRKITVDAAIRDSTGDLCAVARALWIAVPTPG